MKNNFYSNNCYVEIIFTVDFHRRSKLTERQIGQRDCMELGDAPLWGCAATAAPFCCRPPCGWTCWTLRPGGPGRSTGPAGLPRPIHRPSSCFRTHSFANNTTPHWHSLCGAGRGARWRHRAAPLHLRQVPLDFYNCVCPNPAEVISRKAFLALLVLDAPAPQSVRTFFVLVLGRVKSACLQYILQKRRHFIRLRLLRQFIREKCHPPINETGHTRS